MNIQELFSFSTFPNNLPGTETLNLMCTIFIFFYPFLYHYVITLLNVVPVPGISYLTLALCYILPPFWILFSFYAQQERNSFSSA